MYDGADKLRYIGIVGYGKTTTFYSRVYGHGGGAHYKKEYMRNNIKKCKVICLNEFYNAFDELDNYKKIKIIKSFERILIREFKPDFNDLYIEQSIINDIKVNFTHKHT